MSDQRVGSAFRAVRLRRGLRQSDVAARAHVSRALVSQIERGHIGSARLDTVREIGSVLDIRIDVVGRWRGGELDRLMNSGHSALAESVTRWLEANGWTVLPEVSFSIFGERGVIDLLAWHAASSTVLVIELKTLLVDIQELIGVTHRKTRLAAGIAKDQGWTALRVATVVVVSDTGTNRRRVADHARVMRTAYPVDGRTFRAWLKRPYKSVSALVFHADVRPRSANSSFAGQQRVRTRQAA